MRNRQSLTLAACLLLAVAVSALGLAWPGAARAAGPGWIDAYVSGQNSAGIPGVTVHLLGAAGQQVASGVTDYNARVVFQQLDLGTYYLSADAGPLSLGVFYPSALTLAEATPIVLTEASPIASAQLLVLEASGLRLGAAARPDGSRELATCLLAQAKTLSSDGTTVVAGEPWLDTARVFAHTEAGWRLQGMLRQPVESENTFGWHHDVDGDTLAITDIYNGGAAGNVWIYRRVDGVWTLEQTLAPTGPAYRSFGVSLAISGDTLMVGAPEATVDGEEWAGAVYVYTRSGSTWTRRDRLTLEGEELGSGFGRAVSLQGSTAAISAPELDWGGQNSAGAVFVFTGDGSDWRRRAELRTSDGLFVTDFGEAVALDHGTIAAGCSASPDSGAIYVFTGAGASWSQQVRLTPADGNGGWHLGDRMALDGDTILATAYARVPAGYADGVIYVFRRTGDTWVQESELMAPNQGSTGWMIGDGVAVAGGDLLVGSPREPYMNGALRVYHPYVTGLSQTLTVPAGNGVLANDSSSAGQALTAAPATSPEHGVLDLRADGSFTYAPAEGWAGDDTFTYTASDGAWTSGPTTVTVTTRDPNAPNVDVEDVPRGWVNTPVTVTLKAEDDTQVRQIDYRRRSAHRWILYTGPFTVSAEGATTYEHRALDVFANVSRAGTLTVKVDTRRPVPRIPQPATVTRGRTAAIRYLVADPRPGSPRAAVEISVTGRGREQMHFILRGRPVGKLLSCKFPCNLPRGRYSVLVTATDAAGNLARRPARSTLTVR